MSNDIGRYRVRMLVNAPNGKDEYGRELAPGRWVTLLTGYGTGEDAVAAVEGFRIANPELPRRDMFAEFIIQRHIPM